MIQSQLHKHKPQFNPKAEDWRYTNPAWAGLKMDGFFENESMELAKAKMPQGYAYHGTACPYISLHAGTAQVYIEEKPDLNYDFPNLAENNHWLFNGLMQKSAPRVCIKVAAHKKATCVLSAQSAQNDSAADKFTYNNAHSIIDIHLEADAELTLIENWQGESSINHLLVAKLEDNGKFKHITLQDVSQNASFIAHDFISLGNNSVYDGQSFQLGGSYNRRERNILAQGRHTNVSWQGCALGYKSSAHDLMKLQNSGIKGDSQISYRGLSNDKSTSFQGLVTIQSGANKCRTNQQAKGLLLSEKASVMLKPELEIFHDDVEAAHGAVTSAIDEAQLFYATSRGLSAKTAEALIAYGFCIAEFTKIDSWILEALQEKIQTMFDVKSLQFDE